MPTDTKRRTIDLDNSVRSTHPSTIPMITFMVAFSLSAGCIHYYQGPSSELTLSSNGRLAAYWHESGTAIGFVEAREIGHSVRVKWGDVERPFFSRSKQFYEFSGQLPGIYGDRALAFSPDSRFLAALIAGTLHCIDSESNKTWRLSSADEYVSSFSWVTTDELAYARIKPAGAFFKRRVQDAYSTPIPVMTGSLPTITPLERRWEPWEEYVGLPHPHEWWSPGGRLVLFAWTDGVVQLLDTSTGVMREYPNSPVSIAAGWKDDGSVCFVALGDVHFKPKRAFLISAGDGSVKDLTDPFLETFAEPNRNELHRQPSLLTDPQGWVDWGVAERASPVSMTHGGEIRWTADGRYITITSRTRGGCLVQLDPWEVVPIRERFNAVMKDYDAYRREERFFKHLMGSIQPLPIAGWVKTWLGGNEFGINYEKKEIIELHAHGGDIAPPCVVTRDGKRMVTLHSLGNLKSTPLDLPHSRVISRW